MHHSSAKAREWTLGDEILYWAVGTPIALLSGVGVLAATLTAAVAPSLALDYLVPHKREVRISGILERTITDSSGNQYRLAEFSARDRGGRTLDYTTRWLLVECAETSDLQMLGCSADTSRLIEKLREAAESGNAVEVLSSNTMLARDRLAKAIAHNVTYPNQ